MTTFDYPDPLEVGVEVLARRGRYAWGLMADSGLQLSGALPADATLIDAQMEIMKVLLEHPELTGAPVNLLCADADMHRALTDLRQLVPHVEPRPFSDRLKTHPRVRAARAVAHSALDQIQPKAEPAQMVAGTDGSFGRHGRLAGWGWVTDNGRYGFGHLEAHDVLVAELAAIRALLESVPRTTHLTVLSDSRAALSLVGLAQDAAAAGTPVGHPSGVRRTDAQVAAIASLLTGDRPVKFSWVRGHSGHPLNEGADRLAVHARRTATANVEQDLAVEVAENIAAETVQAVTAAREAARAQTAVEVQQAQAMVAA